MQRLQNTNCRCLRRRTLIAAQHPQTVTHRIRIRRCLIIPSNHNIICQCGQTKTRCGRPAIIQYGRRLASCQIHVIEIRRRHLPVIISTGSNRASHRITGRIEINRPGESARLRVPTLRLAQLKRPQIELRIIHTGREKRPNKIILSLTC